MDRNETTENLLTPAQGLADADPKQVLERYLVGHTTSEIAASYGVAGSQLTRWLRTVAEEQWKDIQVEKALRRKDKADELIETATDHLELARAREMLKSAQWDLERTYRRIYGQDVPPFARQIGVIINLRREEREPTEGAVTIESTPQRRPFKAPGA